MRNSLGKVEQLDLVIVQMLSQRGILLKKGVRSTRTMSGLERTQHQDVLKVGMKTPPSPQDKSAKKKKRTPPTAESHYHTTYRAHYRSLSESKDEIFADKSQPLGDTTGPHWTDRARIKTGCCKPLRAIQIPKIDYIGKLTRRVRPLSGLVENATSKKR